MTSKQLPPVSLLKTARLTLRQLKSSDDKEIFALRSNRNVNKYLNRKPSDSMDDARHFITSIQENIQNANSLYWAITIIETDKLIGTICLYNFSGDYSKVEIGFELLPDLQGKGLMKEAIAEVLHFAFRYVGVNSIEAYTHPDNVRSISLLEKLNFKRHRVDDETFTIFRLTAR
ncbi:N-acetyltransferase [Segetibacter sp. 3557_3]|uniref:GNAT family N-acetyltransferase n=1 Tax=Segetibacter sp. 3557_3 TaxID=2547429 RepID=UPI0010590E50|nr:GNAT family N-acetyltransferase [Segetibacter sp. 3557_3]TDH26931.1 N-acetyltransferase [Segetibacter sp. 3557_3]